MKTRRRIALIALCAVVAGFVAVQATYVKESAPAVLRVGILPDQSEEVLREKFAPFVEYLSAATGIDVRLVLPASYDDLVQLFREHDVDLAYFGGLTYVRAHALYGAVPLVMREVDMRFTSTFLARGGDTSDDLADFKGKTFTFGSPLSTSGHLMPRHFMQTEMQFLPEEFFSRVGYSGTHDATAYLVRDGVVDLGVANTRIIKNMIEDGRLKEGDIHVVWQSPPYIDYVWVVHKNMKENFRTRLRDAFLALSVGDNVHRKVLESLDAEVFFPAGSNDFLGLEQIASSLGLLDAQRQ